MPLTVAALHAGYWLLYLLLIALLLLVGRLPGRLDATAVIHLLRSPLVVLSIVPNVAAFYASYGALFSRLLARRRVGPLVISAIAVCAMTAAGGLVLLRVLYGPAQPVFGTVREAAALALLLAALAAVHVTIALIMRGSIDWYRGLAVKEALTRRTHDMELALVRSRLDPHFLFNTLNNLDVLIARDAAAASEYLTRLSEIMRFVLYESKEDAIPLTSELAYIEKYIALERLRTRRAGYVTHDVDGDPSGIWIAPMTLIPFVENAFKHSEARKADGAIVSRVTIDGRRVTFECVNHFRAGDGDTGPGGIGHALIRQRLELLYRNRHTLEAGPHGDQYRVHLTIETADDPLRHR